MLSGGLLVKWGDRLEKELKLDPGDMVYVPPRETHVLENTSDTEGAEYVVARDSPHEDAVIVPWPRRRGEPRRRARNRRADTQGFLEGAGGRRIFWQSWGAGASPRAVIVIVHGASEHTTATTTSPARWWPAATPSTRPTTAVTGAPTARER